MAPGSWLHSLWLNIFDQAVHSFVWPHQYTAVIVALKSKVRCKDIELHASSVIISQSLVPSLEASISTILSNKNVRPNREGIACVANTHWRIEKKARHWRIDHGKRWTGGLESL